MSRTRRHIVDITPPVLEKALNLPKGSLKAMEVDFDRQALVILVGSADLPRYEREEGEMFQSLRLDDVWDELDVEAPDWVEQVDGEDDEEEDDG